MKLEYISSAMNYVWVGGLETCYTDEVIAELDRVTKIINTWDDDHKFGVLFNAYAEPRMGEVMTDFFSSTTIQGDSGGLQMISLGHTPTPALRSKVYEIQAKYATQSMCFDEIPLQKSGIVQFANLNALLYDNSMVPACAKQTALNIIEQVEYFDKVNSKSKVFMIIQGNDRETYQGWTTEILKHLPTDVVNQLYGIASGGGCLGNDTLEDIERYFTLSHLDAPDHLLHNFHLLGVGAPNRIVTLAAMSHLFKDKHISYDSTKHTGGITRAQIQLGHQCVAIGSRQRNAKYMKLWNAFNAFQHKLAYSFKEEDFFEAIMMSADERYAKYGQPKDNLPYTFKSNYMRFAILAFSVYNMFEVIKKVKTGEKVSTSHDAAILRTLKSITSIDTFDAWKRQYSKYVSSSRVESADNMSSNLGEFFG